MRYQFKEVPGFTENPRKKGGGCVLIAVRNMGDLKEIEL
jgi:hypothetical protein